jgi:glutamate racemase
MPRSATRTPRSGAPNSSDSSQRIGVFDSGVGGLSVLRELRRALPGHALHYVADSGHAPYGERDETHVMDRSKRVVSHLVAHGAQAVVIACNTATAIAAAHLRAAWPQLPFIGVEPGIKPALALSRNGRIGVMATAATLASDKFQRLVATHGAGQFIHLQACVGLAAAIERGELDAPELLALIETHCRPLRDASVDTVVLGCTHYPFVQAAIQRALGSQVQIVDTAVAVARHAATLLAESAIAHRPSDGESDMLLETTGDASRFERFARRCLPIDGPVIAAAAVCL